MSVRTATIEDARAISAVRVETWRAAYAGLMDAAILEHLDAGVEAERRAERWEAMHADDRMIEVVAEQDGTVIGWGCAGPSNQSSMPAHGQVYALYVLRSHWSTGAGHELLTVLEAGLRDRGYRRALLHVLDGNERAARCYERHGWREDGVTLRDDRFAGGQQVDALLERQRIRDLDEVVAG